MESDEYGYEDNRFENAVSDNFHCPICLNVFKDPVMCHRNQHCFCRRCITRHLENSERCPSCMEELTLETITEAPRIFISCWSELKIRCDYFSRGCREFVELGDLEAHIKDCGFTPVQCSNEGCIVEINKRDRIHHETEACEFRKVKCHNCSEIRKEIDGVKMNLKAVTEKVEEIKTAVTDQVEEVKVNLAAVSEKVEDFSKEMKEIKTNQTEIKVNQTEIKVNLTEIKAQLTTLSDQIKRNSQTTEKKTTETQRRTTDAANDNEYVVIAGGRSGRRRLKSVEMFDSSEKSWSPLQPMKETRDAASSFIYENKIFITGGVTEHGRTNTMERMNINPIMSSQQWFDFPAKLPAKLFGNSSVVYNERLIVIGGKDDDGYSDSIHEVPLSPLCTPKFLSRMPQPRIYHGVELFNDEILIVGGRKGLISSSTNTLNSVVTYDISKNECKETTPLPFAVSEMATVRWGDNVVVIGGVDKDGNVLNTVVVYNVQTGKSYMLPEMKCKRRWCVAVVSQNTIVVMGGKDERGTVLNSVEGFSFDSYSWRDLPPMNEARSWATAVAW